MSRLQSRAARLAPTGARAALLVSALTMAVALVACTPPRLVVSDPPAPRGAGGNSGGGSPATAPPLSLPDAGADAAPADAGGPTAETCAGEAHAATVVPVDLYLLLDVSGSMTSLVGGRSKWSLVKDALGSFLADPRSAGLGVGLQVFPQPAPCQNDRDCSPLSGAIGYQCRARAVCFAPGLPVHALAACDDFEATCPTGTTCTPLRRCRRSGRPCLQLQLGQPCGASADDLCEDPGRRCRPALATGCHQELYAQPALPVGELPGWHDPLALTVAAISPGGGTPMAPAVAASLPLVKAQAAARPGRQAVFVLATDGLPTGCGIDNTVDLVALSLEEGRRESPALATYVIGVFQAQELARSTAALQFLAQAGGTGAPLVIEEGQDLAHQFLRALEQIRGTALACSFAIPRPASGPLDYGQVNVRFSPSGGPGEDLLYVASPDRCAAGGWHYDVDPKRGTPTRIVICAPSCQRFEAATAGAVELRVGCSSRIE